MADRAHIAITTGDTLTTRSKVSVAACPVVRFMSVSRGVTERHGLEGTVPPRTGIRWIPHRVNEDPGRTGRVTTVTQVFATPPPHSGSSDHSGHEQVVFCQDAPTGLRAIVAIYSTALGPALGGTRFYPYQSEALALADALNLSRAMTYKAALAGLDLGGGKAVIIGDPATLKTEALLRAYGRFVESLGGRYITACDVGTYSADMDMIARECRYVTGRTEAAGGAGDSSVLTALRRVPGHAGGRRACLGQHQPGGQAGRGRGRRQGRSRAWLITSWKRARRSSSATLTRGLSSGSGQRIRASARRTITAR